jgi:uncharacterized protein
LTAVAELIDRVLKCDIDRLDAVTKQILETDHEWKTESAGPGLVNYFEKVNAAAIFLKRLGNYVAFGIYREITAAPTVNIVSRDRGLDVPVFHLFVTRGAQPQTHNDSARRTCKETCKNLRQSYSQLFTPLVFPARTDNVRAGMNKTVIEVQVRAVLPTSGGCAVFIGNNDKVFIIYVDQTVGSAITMFMRDITKERPLTHDLMAHLMTALGAKVERVIINDLKNATYYARTIIRAENELQQKKIIELDARPSDCIAMATQQKAPIYVSQEVWDEVDDMSDVLRKMEEEGLKPDPETESEE